MPKYLMQATEEVRIIITAIVEAENYTIAEATTNGLYGNRGFKEIITGDLPKGWSFKVEDSDNSGFDGFEITQKNL